MNPPRPGLRGHRRLPTTARAGPGGGTRGPVAARSVSVWALPALAAGEMLLLAWYDDRGERSHWLTHLLVGAVVGLLALTFWVRARGRAPRSRAGVPAVVVVVAAAQLLGSTPDLLEGFGLRQGRWMDVFLGSVSAHYTPAGNLTWAALAIAAAVAYASALRAVRPPSAPRGRRARRP